MAKATEARVTELMQEAVGILRGETQQLRNDSGGIAFQVYQQHSAELLQQAAEIAVTKTALEEVHQNAE